MITERAVAIVQGAYFATTGVWPLVSMRTFEAVTGPKTDRWLVKTVGLLIGVVGSTLLARGVRGAPARELRWIALGSAVALAAVDDRYASIGRISNI